MLITVLLGILFGVLAAMYHDTIADRSIRSFYLAGIASPTYLIALVLVIVFGYWLHLFPTSGAADPNIPPPTSLTGFPVLDSLLEFNLPYFATAILHLILPSMSLALGVFGVLVRVLRSSILDIMQTNYIRVARAKGADEYTIFFRHALSNSMLPVITVSSLLFTSFLTGTIFVEYIFAYPGIGNYLVNALSNLDYPGILGSTIVLSILVVLVNLVADLLYAMVDPQVRYG
jgi:peptide/nickel transport system permease protein